MTLEDFIYDEVFADVQMQILLEDRIYTAGTIGDNGITPESTPDVYDSSGILLPCLFIRERDIVVDDQIVDWDTNSVSAGQSVELYFYQQRLYDSIDSLLARSRKLLMGKIYENSFELQLSLEVNRLRDTGALKKASMARQDWFVNIIL